ncbi:MAG: 2-oxo acid dehydrogenase subunit E2 [Holosporaceae bacterium]|jgi:pyruvate/2-oxoglutarate dehydrogenase complex dihydrolipoamide acyltransferase (E2) component|nr:2-oxo acid dehydrogenase subunit E2 [Holosporaceae bacterium]
MVKKPRKNAIFFEQINTKAIFLLFNDRGHYGDLIMRIDIIVPNFDNSSEEVVLSSWYKSVGERISKNEIVADAETMSVACGITSSYDCILVKILVEEGAVIPQGTKIAVIETDLSADISDVIRSVEIMEAKIVSDVVGSEIQNEIHEENQIFNDFTSKGHGLSVPLVETSVEKSVKIEEEIIGEVYVHTEEKCMNILKNAENQAREESHKLKEKIIEEARRLAFMQAEELKCKILREYEEKATRDASEMHKKIIQGSIQEAENTKLKLIDEARERALKEAENIRYEIISNAEKEAKYKAETTIKDAISNAKEEAKQAAELLSKEIIEEAINESKMEAKAIKKDIIHSARKHAAKESKTIVKEIVKDARMRSHVHAEELIESTTRLASNEAELLKEEILKIANNEICGTTHSILESAINEINKKIENNIRDVMNDGKIEACNEIRESASSMLRSIIVQINQEMGKDLHEVVDNTRRNACSEISESMHSVLNSIITEINQKIGHDIYEMVSEVRKIACDNVRGMTNLTLKRVVAEINEKMECDVREAVDDARKNAYKEIKSSIEKTIGNVKADVIEKIEETTVEMVHFAVVEINKNMYESVHRTVNVLKNETCKKHVAEINTSTVNSEITDVTKNETTEQFGNFTKEESDLHNKVLKEKNCEIEEQNRIVKKLLSVEQESNTPEVYADNWNKPKFFETPGDYNEPIDFLRRRISEKMRDSYDASVISTVSNEVNMGAILALEKTFGNAFSKKHNTRLGFTPFFISASIAALKQYRIFNAHIHNDEIIYKNNFDISIITCGNDGIAAPVIRHADAMTIAEIEVAMIHLSRRAIEGTLSIEEASGGTFTVVNAGIYGSLIGTDLLTPPQVATLSVHKMHNRPVVADGGMEIRPMLYISLSYDHRISDTRKASEFLSNIKNYVENPGWQILGLHE